MDNFAHLKNENEIGNDCGLHAMIVPVLLQAVLHCMFLKKSSCCIGRTSCKDDSDICQERELFLFQSPIKI